MIDEEFLQFLSPSNPKGLEPISWPEIPYLQRESKSLAIQEGLSGNP
jgi:hypothetical protein